MPELHYATRARPFAAVILWPEDMVSNLISKVSKIISCAPGT
jgi:hypothetical protein